MSNFIATPRRSGHGWSWAEQGSWHPCRPGWFMQSRGRCMNQVAANVLTLKVIWVACYEAYWGVCLRQAICMAVCHLFALLDVTSGRLRGGSLTWSSEQVKDNGLSRYIQLQPDALSSICPWGVFTQRCGAFSFSCINTSGSVSHSIELSTFSCPFWRDGHQFWGPSFIRGGPFCRHCVPLVSPSKWTET